MSASTKQRHRPTPTADLRADNARLAAENERLDTALQVLAEQMSTVTEHLFPVAGQPAGEVRRILARRRGTTTKWGVFDDTLGSHRFWADTHRWYWTTSAPSDVVYPYTEQEARRLARLLAGQPALPGDELDAGYLAAQAVHLEVQAAEEALAQAVRNAEATAAAPDEVNVAKTPAAAVPLQDRGPQTPPHSVPVAEDDSFTMPAPVDEPDYEPEPADMSHAEPLLSMKAQGIPANTEQDTVALPQARQLGPDDTTVLPAPDLEVAYTGPLPPLPEVPPVIGPFPPIAWGVPKPTDPLARPDLKKQVSAAEVARHKVIHVRLP